MTDDIPDNNYSYKGWLVFNGLFGAERKTDKDPEEVIRDLPQYTKPSPGKKMKGYRRTEFDDILSRAGDVTYDLHHLAENLTSFEYKRTTWNSNIVYQNGKKTTGKTPTHKGAEVFWHEEKDLLVFRGQKAWLNQNRKNLRGALSEKVRLTEINFDFDFFLWVLHKKFIGQGLTTELSVREINSAETTLDQEQTTNTGNDLSISRSSNVLRSTPFISSLLEGNKPRMIEGQFVLGSDQIRARLEHGGKIHIKVTDSKLGELGDLRRMSVGLRFIFNLLHQYQLWESLPPTEKYPEPSFFYDLAENMEDEGYEVTGPLRRVPEEYERKRAGEMVDDGARAQEGSSQHTS